MIKEIVVGVAISCSFGAIAWMVATLISVDKRTEVMAIQVSANHDMLKPLWEDFIQRQHSYGNLKITDKKTSFKTSFQKEEESKKESW
tara:strand:- start:2718 stop:2981 length:264 start_codon:yes stop_codon:yes gene_type:complete